jgi:hypothetical protein
LNRHDWPFSMPSTAASPPSRQSAHKSGSKLGDYGCAWIALAISLRTM